MRRLDAAEAKRLREAAKDAGGQQVEWRATRLPSGLLVRQHLSFAVETTPPPSTGHLMVDGVWKSPEQIQIFLYLVEGAGQTSVARLCLTPKHGRDLHFHDERDRVTSSLSVVPTIVNENTMLDEVFIPTMKISNLARPMLP